MSDALRTLQGKIGAVADGAFGPNTAKAIAKHYDFTPARGAHFLGQVIHESGTFRYTTESLSYSADRLLKTFKRYFKDEEHAAQYARNPEKLANYVYMDVNRSKKSQLGNIHEGDGWLWRGRGFLQVTGRSNYRAFASEMRLPDVIKDPDLVATDYPLESAIWFFDRNNIWNICDKGVDEDTIRKVTKKVNGGQNGIDHRIKETTKIYDWLS